VDRTIDPKTVSFPAHHNFSVATAFEILAYGGLQFVANPLAKRIADIDMFT